MSTGSHEAVLTILDQLMKCTEQLSELSVETELDVSAMSLACKSGLEALQSMLPLGLAAFEGANVSGVQTEGGLQIVEAFKALEIKTRESLSILREAMDQTETQMASLRGRRKAIRAYGRIGR